MLVADYVFRLSGGEEVRVPIRERFEIAVLGVWASTPFRAVSDQQDSLRPRYEGAWQDVGWRQTESEFGSPHGYYLWAWRNPHPDRMIQTLEIIPKGPRFLVAALTLGALDEHPFVRQGRRGGPHHPE